MTEKEMRKLSRGDLLEMLIAQSQELQTCKEKLAAAETALLNRQIQIDNAGSIAEASLALNGVFNAAELACQQYMENIRLLSERQESVCAQMEAEGRSRAQQIILDAEQKRDAIFQETQQECCEMRQRAQADSQRYWDEVTKKLEAFYEAHAGLRELMATLAPAGK